jgi:riboflavin kinase/FMN adenylyltransferase
VLAFEPHPQEFFRPSPESFRLTPFRTKARLIAEQGADAMYALAFDAEMAVRPAQDFVMDVLVESLGVGAWWWARISSSARAARATRPCSPIWARWKASASRSSSRSRPRARQDFLDAHPRRAESGTPEEAAHLLGHWWAVEARVEHGDKRGRTIGFPTANMRLDHCLKPAFGVYAVRATIIEDDKPAGRYDGVANFGIRPMFETTSRCSKPSVRFRRRSLRQAPLAVELVAYLRPEAKLAGKLDALKAQIFDLCGFSGIGFARDFHTCLQFTNRDGG